jgi:hypothetical protein
VASELSEPTCSKCRWHKVATVAGDYPDSRQVLGIMVQANGWDGFRSPSGQHFKALGAVYCEHKAQPRGLVLTNYACRNFERPAEVEMQGQLSGTGRSYEDMLP